MSGKSYSERHVAEAEAFKREQHKSKSLSHMHWGVEEQEDGSFKVKLIKHGLTPAEARERQRAEREALHAPLDEDGLTLAKIGLAAQIFGPEAVANALVVRAALKRHSGKDAS